MGIEAIAPVISERTTVVDEVLSKAVGSGERLAAFKYFPQPMFLIDRSMNLIERNKQGELALDNRWIALSSGKLHFNCQENDRYVRKTVDSIGTISNECYSARFVLRSLDMVCRSYTISAESATSSNLILTIQGDLTCTESKMESVARAFSLTCSEAKIAKMMVAGLKPKEIAYEVGISLNTVRSHLRTLYAKMQVRSYNDALTQVIRLLV